MLLSLSLLDVILGRCFIEYESHRVLSQIFTDIVLTVAITSLYEQEMRKDLMDRVCYPA